MALKRGMAWAVGVWSALAMSACRCAVSEFETDLGTVVVEDAGPPVRVTTTGCWAPPVVVADVASLWSAITVLPSGDALVLWYDFAGLSSRVLFLDGGMSPTSTLDRTGPREALEAVQLEGHEKPAAIWVHRHDAGATREVVLARFDPDGGWAPAERLDEAAKIEHVAVGVDRAGQITAAWLRGDVDTTLVTRRSNGSGWFDPERLTLTGSLVPPALRVSADGLAVLGWGWSRPWANEAYTEASVWSGGVRSHGIVSAGRASVDPPALAVEGRRAVMLTSALPNDLALARLDEGRWVTAKVDAGGVFLSDVNVGFNQAHEASAWMLLRTEAGGTQWWLGTTVESDAGWSPLALEPLTGTPRQLRVVTNERGHVVASWADDDALVVRRPGQAADDVLSGLVSLRYLSLSPPTVAIGPSGATWLLAIENEAPMRLLALRCQ
ncbi:MAG: hypothetical protein ACOZQL_04975 [Myxococcota bacterium]